MEAEERAEMAEEWLSRRLDAGLFGIQMTDLILAWLCAEDSGAKKRIEELLRENKLELGSVRATLKGMFAHVVRSHGTID